MTRILLLASLLTVCAGCLAQYRAKADGDGKFMAATNLTYYMVEHDGAVEFSVVDLKDMQPVETSKGPLVYKVDTAGKKAWRHDGGFLFFSGTWTEVPWEEAAEALKLSRPE